MIEIFEAVREIVNDGRGNRRKRANEFLKTQNWPPLTRYIGVYAFVNLSPCGEYIIKYCGVRPLQLPPLSEVAKYPLLDEVYLRPIMQDPHVAIQPYAHQPIEGEVGYNRFIKASWNLRATFIQLYGCAFDTKPANCGQYNGRLVHFDPKMKDEAKY